MQPSEAINLVEVLLRDLVRTVVGARWIEHGNFDREVLATKQRTEATKRRGSVVSADLLDYTEFTQIQNYILRHWDLFSPALGDKARVSVYLKRLESFRNPAMHSRDLLPFEKDLVNGMVGELRNLITIYRSQMSTDGQYYPQLEQIVDSFGNAVAGEHRRDWPTRLQVGQTVTFDCSGRDPQDRELTWFLQSNTGNRELDEQTGERCTLTWKVTEEDVSAHTYLEFRMKSSGRYHRHGNWDMLLIMSYPVDPPAPPLYEAPGS